MTHHASPEFWTCYNALPIPIREHADKAFELLKSNPQHPSLHFKKISRFWSARVGLHYRAVGVDAPDGIVWFWIGTHADYDKLFEVISFRGAWRDGSLLTHPPHPRPDLSPRIAPLTAIPPTTT